MKWLFTADFLKIFLPVFVALLGWMGNEYFKRTDKEYIRKEERYVELVKSLRGFQAHRDPNDPQTREARQTFLDQLNLCWLYCPDKIVEKGYALVATLTTGAGTTDKARQEAAGEFVLAVRRDLFSRGWFRGTKLKAKDFEILKVN